MPPYKPDIVHAFCVLVENTDADPKVSVAGVCLEQQMYDLLTTKSATNGKNSGFFEEKNVIAGTHQTNGLPATMFAISEEAKRDIEGVLVSPTDCRNVLRTKVMKIEHTG